MKVVWQLKRTANGYAGTILLPVGAAGMVEAKAAGPTQRAALTAAAGLAGKLLESPLLAAAMPPGTVAAVKATQLLAKHGPAALKKLTGEGAKRIASVLKSIF